MSIRRAMERIREAETEVGLRDNGDNRHELYRKTFRALGDVTPEDDDEGITVVTNWILEEIETNEERPSSRAVRRRARQYCQDNGYEISNNDWLGV